MFVVSMKTSKSKLAAIALAVIALAAVVIFLPGGGEPVNAKSGINYSAATAEERIAFLSQFGWEIDEEPAEVSEILIPAEFDQVYLKYNEIQKAQELDLSKFCGMRVKRWTYTVKNYPGYTADASGKIRVNLLVHEGKIIGGDVCSVELDGFMHGFDRPVESAATLTDAPAS